ncbi:MAG: DUF4138 domain-containing protein, partial [Calditrichaeota bacterium]|nr:DUF4138 domain-containing protein [Calditrichota bacterium]
LFLVSNKLTSLRLPEPYTDIVPANATILDFHPANGKNKQIVLIKPKVKSSQAGLTNLYVYTEHYEFSILVHINKKNYTDRLIIDSDKIYPTEKTSNTVKKVVDNLDGIVAKTKFDLDSLVNVKKDILLPSSSAPSQIVSNVTMALDYVFYYLNKIVFKMSIINNSTIPYSLNAIRIKYIEEAGIPLYNEKTTKNLTLNPFFEDYSYQNKIVPSDSIMHMLYVIDKLGVKNDGIFLINVIEQNGNRNFEIRTKSEVGN